ncbi:hypothetical protein GCM10027030_20560 [Luteococcus sediminum]
MIEGLLALFAFQALGTLLASSLHLAVPGPVVGMLLLLAHLTVRPPHEQAPVMRAGNRILDELPLLFIPAGVGLVGCVSVIRQQWLPISTAMVLGWAAGLLATVGAARLALGTALPGRQNPQTDCLATQAPELVADGERMDGLEPEPVAPGPDGRVDA